VPGAATPPRYVVRTSLKIARLYLLDDDEQIKVEQVVFYAASA
jgi:hypothetical protein